MDNQQSAEVGNQQSATSNQQRLYHLLGECRELISSELPGISLTPNIQPAARRQDQLFSPESEASRYEQRREISRNVEIGASAMMSNSSVGGGNHRLSI